MAADIRACVAYARSEYKPTSLGLMGFCYGGGRALEEAAAGNAVYTPHEVSVRCTLRGVNTLIYRVLMVQDCGRLCAVVVFWVSSAMQLDSDA